MNVSGSLATVINDVPLVTGVWVRAKRASPYGDGLVLGSMEKADYNPDTGVVSFSAEPVEAVLIVQGIDRSESFEMIIPDKPTASLRECVEAKTVYHPAVVADGVAQIRAAQSSAMAEIVAARQTALNAVESAVSSAVTAQMGAKADKTQVDQVQALAMSALGIGGSALRKVNSL